MRKRVYVDSCIAIYNVEVRQPWYGPIQVALSELPQVCVSELVRLECLVLPVRTGDQSLHERFDFFLDNATTLDLPSAVYRLATDLRARHNLKTPDAIHLAAAIHHRCDEFWTNDHRLDRAARGVTVRAFEPSPGR